VVDHLPPPNPQHRPLLIGFAGLGLHDVSAAKSNPRLACGSRTGKVLESERLHDEEAIGIAGCLINLIAKRAQYVPVECRPSASRSIWFRDRPIRLILIQLALPLADQALLNDKAFDNARAYWEVHARSTSQDSLPSCRCHREAWLDLASG
jgi:hypothetical protein